MEKVGREVVIEWVKRHYEFFGSQFVEYMTEHGYSAQTAYNWLNRLQKEGVIQRRVRNRRGVVYRSLIYKKGDSE